MSFVKKEWKKRISEYPTRRRLVRTDGSSEIVDVERAEGNISQDGDPFSDENMNDLENRIFEETNKLNTKFNDYLPKTGGNVNSLTIAGSKALTAADVSISNGVVNLNLS